MRVIGTVGTLDTVRDDETLKDIGNGESYRDCRNSRHRERR